MLSKNLAYMLQFGPKWQESHSCTLEYILTLSYYATWNSLLHFKMDIMLFPNTKMDIKQKGMVEKEDFGSDQ